MMGLTLANVISVPIATWLGQQFGWKSGFEFSAVLAFITLIGVSLFAPNIPLQKTASIKAELAGLKNINIWLTLAVGAIGFGGMFSVYSYVSPILTEYTHRYSYSPDCASHLGRWYGDWRSRFWLAGR